MVDVDYLRPIALARLALHGVRWPPAHPVGASRPAPRRYRSPRNSSAGQLPRRGNRHSESYFRPPLPATAPHHASRAPRSTEPRRARLELGGHRHAPLRTRLSSSPQPDLCNAAHPGGGHPSPRPLACLPRRFQPAAAVQSTRRTPQPAPAPAPPIFFGNDWMFS